MVPGRGLGICASARRRGRAEGPSPCAGIGRNIARAGAGLVARLATLRVALQAPMAVGILVVGQPDQGGVDRAFGGYGGGVPCRSPAFRLPWPGPADAGAGPAPAGYFPAQSRADAGTSGNLGPGLKLETPMPRPSPSVVPFGDSRLWSRSPFVRRNRLRDRRFDKLSAWGRQSSPQAGFVRGRQIREGRIGRAPSSPLLHRPSIRNMVESS